MHPGPALLVMDDQDLKLWPELFCSNCPEANIIKNKDKLLGRYIPYFTRKIWNKTTQ